MKIDTSQMRQKARTLAVAMLRLYAISIITLAILWWLYPTVHSIIALSNIFAIVFFFPIIPCIMIAIWLGSRVAWASVGVIGVLFLVLFGGSMIPQGAHAVDGATTLRVVTFNQLYSNNNAADVLAIIEEQDADIVLVQELNDAVAEVLGQQREHYPYQVLHPNSAYPSGMGVISRHPIVHEEQIGGISWSQSLMFDLDGRELRLLHVHPVPPRIGFYPVGWGPVHFFRLSFDTTGRDEQLQIVLDLADQINGPLIVAGDLNTSDREAMYAPFAARLTDAHHETAWGLGYTYPSAYVGFPRNLFRVRIDYVFTSRDMPPVAAWVNCQTPSDHCLVAADIAVP